MVDEDDISQRVSKPSKASYYAVCDVVGCSARAEVEDAKAAEATYVAKYGTIRERWLPAGWTSVHLPEMGPQVLAKTARLSEIAGVARDAFVKKEREEEARGSCVFTICPDPAHGDDPELRGPWTQVTAVSPPADEDGE